MDMEVYSSRIIKTPLEKLYTAFSNPQLLARWWGPNGFASTFHEFDLKPGGKWRLTMHGPEGGNYENESVFEVVDALRLIRWRRLSKPLFDMEVGFRKLDEDKTEISFRMIFPTEADCDKIRPFVEPKNEENFDRLEQLLKA